MICEKCGVEMLLLANTNPENTEKTKAATTQLEKQGSNYVVMHVATVSCQNPRCENRGQKHEIRTEIWKGDESDVVKTGR